MQGDSKKVILNRVGVKNDKMKVQKNDIKESRKI